MTEAEAEAEAEAIWEEIEQSESYLVCSMYEEALSLASSVLKQKISHIKNSSKNDMLEAAGMVLVQSLNQLGRTSDIVDELKLSFVSVAAIPVEVLLTGASFQILEGCSDIPYFLEEFLSKWSLLNEGNYILVGSENHIDGTEYCGGKAHLCVDEYLQVVEVYLRTLTEMGLNGVDLAISWVEKAALPQEKCQVLVRRLDNLRFLKAAGSSQSSRLKDDDKAHLSSASEFQMSRASKAALDLPGYHQDRGSANREHVLRLSKLTEPRFWWFRNITLKFGNSRFVISNGKIFLSCLTVLIYYLMRRKQTTLKRMVQKQASTVKKALLDLWQLAFSYQVNPLAIAQPLSGAVRGAQ